MTVNRKPLLWEVIRAWPSSEPSRVAATSERRYAERIARALNGDLIEPAVYGYAVREVTFADPSRVGCGDPDCPECVVDALAPLDNTEARQEAKSTED